MQNVLKHAKFLLSLVFLTEALHGQSKSSQNQKQIIARPPQTRNFKQDNPNNPRNNEYSLDRGENHYSQLNRQPSSPYMQYKPNEKDSAARHSLNINEGKTSASNGEEHGQRSRKYHQKVNSFRQNNQNTPGQTRNSKSPEFQEQSKMIPPPTNQMNKREYLLSHGPAQVGKAQRPIRLFPDPYDRALDKHLQEKEGRPVYEDYRKAPGNSRKAIIYEEASEENSRWHESQAVAPPSKSYNHKQEISSYLPGNQFENWELQSPQQSHSGNEYSTASGQPPNSDSQKNLRKSYHLSERTPLSGSPLEYSENEKLHESVTRKHSKADLAHKNNLSNRSNFPTLKGISRTVSRPFESENNNLRYTFRGHLNENPSTQDNLHLRQNYPPSEGSSRSATQSENLRSEYLPDSIKQHSNRDFSSQNNFNPQILGNGMQPHNHNSPDYEYRSTIKDYPDQRQQNFRGPSPAQLEAPNFRENSQNHASNIDNLPPSQSLPHSSEGFPSNHKVFSNEKTPSSQRSVQSSKHDFENTPFKDNYPNYSEKQQQSEGHSDFSNEYTIPFHQNNQNSASSFRPSSKNGQGRNQQQLHHHNRELHTDYSNRQNKNHGSHPQPQLSQKDYSNDGRSYQELPQPQVLQTDYSNKGKNHQELPQHQELHTDYSNRQGRNHYEHSEPQYHVGYSDENAPDFHQSTHINANSHTQLLEDNIPLMYHGESPKQPQGLKQKYSDKNLPANNEASRTSKIPYVRSFTEGRHLGHHKSFQYLPENSELDDDTLNQKNNPSTSQSEIFSSHNKGREVAIGDYSVEDHDSQPVEEYYSPQPYHDNPSRIRGKKSQSRLKNLPKLDNPSKRQNSGKSYSEQDSRLPAEIEGNNFHRSLSSGQQTAQLSGSSDQNVPVKRSSEDDSAVKNLTFSATVERDHIVSMGSEQEPDSEPEPEERDDDDDDVFNEEQHDGFLDMGAYTDKQGSFGWYADFPVGRGHDKMSYSSS